MNDEPEYQEYEDENGQPAIGLVIHEFEIRGETPDTLYIYKEISKEAADAILNEMRHITTNGRQTNN